MDAALEASLRKAAHKACVGMRQWVDPKDAEQEMWVWYYSKGYELDTEPCIFQAWSVARGYCLKEKAVKLGYSPDDVYFYTRSTVEALIPQTLMSGLPETAVRDNQPRARRPAGEGGDLAAHIMDVRRAMGRLDPADRRFMAYHSQGDETFAVAASESDGDERTLRRQYVRTLDRLVDILGGVKP